MSSYFKKVFELLGYTPKITQQDIETLKSLEKSRGITLPASVLEWYAYENVVNIMKKYSNDDYIVPLHDLGKMVKNWYGLVEYDFIKDGLLYIMTENQGVCNWVVKLDGSDDPPVLVEVDSSPDMIWNIYIERFSDFIFTQIFDHCRESVGVAANDDPLNEQTLFFLRNNYTEGPATFHWSGLNNYRFYKGDMSILIWDGETQADWFLSAQNKESLYLLLKDIWHCGGLSEAIYSYEKEGEEVLSQLRNN